MESFSPTSSMRRLLKRTSAVPWHTVWKPLPYFWPCVWSSNSGPLGWVAELWHRRIRKSANIPSFLPQSSTPIFFLLIPFLIFLLYHPTNLWQSSNCEFRKPYQTSLKNHPQNTQDNVLGRKTHFRGFPSISPIGAKCKLAYSCIPHLYF